jgi:hypothetical protein
MGNSEVGSGEAEQAGRSGHRNMDEMTEDLQAIHQ